MGYTPTQRNPHGAFGELITAHKTPIVQIANKYQIDPSNIETLEIFEATGGSADNSGNLFRCQSGTSAGGYGVLRSKETLNYSAGQGVECLITASFTTGIATSIQFGGMFSLTETLAFGYDGADFSCLHSYGGVAEVQAIRVTATAVGTQDITLDGDSVTGIAVTNSDIETNAEELRAGLVADATLNGKWRFEQVNEFVYCISKSVGDKVGSFSISGSLTATLTEQTAGVVKTDNHTAQASWNVNTAPFSGFDPTQLNLYKIQFGYLGVANITYSIYDPNIGNWVCVHQIEWANANNVTHLGSPNLKVGWSSASLGSSGTNLTVLGGSGAIFLEGDDIKSNDVHAEDNTKTGIAATLTNILTIKNRVVYNNRFNLGKILPIRTTVAIEHNKNAIIEIYKNSTLGGTTNYNYHDQYNSIALIDTAGTTVTGGELIDAFTVETNSEEVINLKDLILKLLPEETLTIAAKTVSGTSTNMVATFTWREEK
jgi:hypothetical protein